MTTAWLRSHPVLAYFALAFGLSWGGVGGVMAVSDFSTAPLRPQEAGVLFALMLLGPGVGGLVMTGLVDGRAGLSALAAGLTRWRVAPRWYAVAVLTAPLLLLAILLGLSALVDPIFAPRFQWMLFCVGLIAGALEEIGWTGLATPRLLARHSALTAGLALGVVWALWHAPVDYRYSAGATGSGWIVEFAFAYVLTLIPWRILMTALFERTRSGLLSILMHASYTGGLLAFVGVMPWRQGLVWQGLFAGTLWVMVAVAVTAPAARMSPVAKDRHPGGGWPIMAVRALHTLIYLVLAASTLIVLSVGVTGRFLHVLWIVGPLVAIETVVLLSNRARCPLTAVVDRLSGAAGSVSDTCLPEALTRRTLAFYGPLLAIGVILLAARGAGLIGGAA
jgi:membrane protease YdiL (CAAX protease family)